jgi:PIN domain nuclease of toxin-antitoxin system
MEVLLDTHVLLWWDGSDPQLGKAARDVIADPNNDVFVSAASSWEIAIKARKGKLTFRGSPSKLITANGFRPLPISPEHGELAGSLDWSHPDPFDRVLVCQAQDRGLVLVHADTTIRAYARVSQLWAR